MNAKLKKQIGRHFRASNTAFCQLENKFIEMMKLSNPASIIPTRKRLAEYVTRIARRSELHPVFYAANLIDHSYNGNRMDSTEISKSMEYLRQCDESILPEVAKFLAKSPPYMAYLFEKQYMEVQPRDWWLTEKARIPRKFGKIVYNSCGSSALNRKLRTELFDIGNHIRKIAEPIEC